MGESASAASPSAPTSSEFIAQLISPLRMLRGNRLLALLATTQTLSLVGDWLYLVALTVLIYTISHSATAVALLTFVRLLPYALFLPVAGFFVDKWDRKRLLIGALLGRTLCMLGLTLVRTPSTVTLAYLLVFLVTTLASLQRPAFNSILPTVVPEDERVLANSLMSQLESLSHIIGPLLGGVLVLLGAVQTAFLITGACALLAAVVIALAPIHPPQPESRPRDSDWLGETIAGYRFLFRENDGVLAACVLAFAGLTLLGGAYWTLAIVLSEQTFHLGGQGIGFLETLYGVGGLIAGLAIASFSRRFSLSRLFIAGGIASAVGAALFGISPAGALPFACMALIGMGDVFTEVNSYTLLQSGTPAELLGRVFGAFEATYVAAMLVGALLVGPLVGALGPRGATVALALSGLATLLLCLPRLRHLERALGVRIFLRRVPILATLSLRALDDIASRVQLERYPALATIVRQGEAGDQLYIVKLGTLDVTTADGAGHEIHHATIGPMDYFGEIALLHDVPRTATIRAREPVELYSLSRASFQQVLQRSADLRDAMLETAGARYLRSHGALLIHR